jgi:hypothetical protein
LRDGLEQGVWCLDKSRMRDGVLLNADLGRELGVLVWRRQCWNRVRSRGDVILGPGILHERGEKNWILRDTNVKW